MARRKYASPQFGVYILKLHKPLGTAKHSAQYYVGWTKCLEGRLWHHRTGDPKRGAYFTAAAIQRGIDFDVLLFIPCASEAEARELEFQIKAYKNTALWVERYQRRQLQAVAA